MTFISVAGRKIEAGTRQTWVECVNIGQRVVSVPIIAVHGAHEGPRVAITGGIHGAEYVAIEAARRLGMSLNPAEVRGSVVVVPIANTTSFQARSIYVSALDEHNLNRVFPGNADGSPAEILADWLFTNILRPAQYYIDMHGGDLIEALVPFVLAPRCDDPEVEAASLEMARATGIARVIQGEVAGSTCGAATAAGIPSVLAEVGGQGRWTDEEVRAHQESTTRILKHLEVITGECLPVTDQRTYNTFAWSRASSTGLFHPDIHVGDEVAEGQTLGTVVDYFGETLQRVEATTSGEIVFLVTSLAINDGDPLLAICA